MRQWPGKRKFKRPKAKPQSESLTELENKGVKIEFKWSDFVNWTWGLKNENALQGQQQRQSSESSEWERALQGTMRKHNVLYKRVLILYCFYPESH